MARRRRKGIAGKWVGRLLTAVLAIPAFYLLAALIGSLVTVNGRWTEAERGTTIYLVDNGIHTDIVMPAAADGLDWSSFLPGDHAPARWIAFGAGESHVYLDTPSWWDIRPGTVWHALKGGPSVIHVDYVNSPDFAARAIRLRPEEYRRLWASVRGEFALDRKARPQRINHPGYGCCDSFYRGVGKASAARTCNNWVADRLRRAGVRTSAWPPFVEGLAWRYHQTRP